MIPQGWNKKDWENFKENNPKNYMVKLKKHQKANTHPYKKIKRYEGFGGLAEDFHYYSNEIYSCWDEGLRPKKEHMQHLLNACKDFIELNKKWEKKNGK